MAEYEREEFARMPLKKKLGNWAVSWAMILPAMIFLVIFTIYPMFNIIRLSLFRGNALNPVKEFVGLDNYKEIFFIKTDFLTALKNTGYYTIVTLVVLITAALLFALWMQKNRKINNVAQVMFFTPHLVATISCAFIWT